MTHKHSSSVTFHRFFHLRLWNTKGISQVNEIIIICTAESNTLTWKLSMDRAWKPWIRANTKRFSAGGKRKRRDPRKARQGTGAAPCWTSSSTSHSRLCIHECLRRKKKEKKHSSLVRCKGDSLLGKDIDKSYTKFALKRCNMDENRIILI